MAMASACAPLSTTVPDVCLGSTAFAHFLGTSGTPCGGELSLSTRENIVYLLPNSTSPQFTLADPLAECFYSIRVNNVPMGSPLYGREPRPLRPWKRSRTIRVLFWHKSEFVAADVGIHTRVPRRTIQIVRLQGFEASNCTRRTPGDTRPPSRRGNSLSGSPR